MGVSKTHCINLRLWILIYWHTLRLGRLWQNMRGFDHATFRSPIFHALCKKRLAQWPPSPPPPFVYSYFEKGCRKKCTRQSRKVLWVVSSALFFQEVWKNGTGGHGHLFTRAKGKQQKYVRQLQPSGIVYWWYSILPFGIVACTFFPTTFLEIAV